MNQITATKARNSLPELVNRTKRDGERIIINFHGKPSAALISYADLQRFQALENARDLKELQQAKAENTSFITLEELQTKRTSLAKKINRKKSKPQP